MISIIVAMSEKGRVIGLEGDMPWKLGADLRRFKKITTGHTVVMGRKTWESIPEKFRPLPNRNNIVLTRQPSYFESLPDGVGVASSFDEVIGTHRALAGSPVTAEWGDLFVIGGSAVFEAALPFAQRLYLTLVDYEGPGDTFFPEDPFVRFEPLEPDPQEEIVPNDEKNTHSTRFLILQRKQNTGS